MNPPMLAEVGPLPIYGLDARSSLQFTGPQAARMRALLAVSWERCLRDAPDAQPAATVAVDAPGNLQASREAFHARLTGVTQQVTRRLIEARLGRLLMFHAGCVSRPADDLALAYVAPGRTGKTTLTALLGRCFGYVTDETVGVRPDWTIAAYPKPLSLRLGADVRVEAGPDSLGLRPTPQRARLAVLAYLVRDQAEDRVSVEKPPLLDAVELLGPQVSGMSRLERPLHLLARLFEDIGPLRVYHYREASSLAQVLAEALENLR